MLSPQYQSKNKMNHKGLRHEWNAISDKGMLPDEIKSRMWINIRRATIAKSRPVYHYIAAACAVLFLSLLGYHYLLTDSIVKAEAIVTKTFKDDIRIIRLPDGTKVWVNQNTEIEYPEKFEGNVRVVNLKGEAFFEVKRNPSKPFIIRSGNITTTVLGTSFNVKAYHGLAPEVNVRTGKVKVEGSNNIVYLERGDAAVYMPTSETLKKLKVLLLEPKWKKALIDVDGLSLEQVIAQLEADYDFKVEYGNAEMKKLKIKGTLDTRHGLPEMLETIAFALNVQIHAKGNDEYLIN